MFIHQGRIVEQSQGSAEIPVQFQSVRSNLYSAIVDMNTSSELQKGDSIIVWFSGSDAAGRAVAGGRGDVDVWPGAAKIQAEGAPPAGAGSGPPRGPAAADSVDAARRLPDTAAQRM